MKEEKKEKYRFASKLRCAFLSRGVLRYNCFKICGVSFSVCILFFFHIRNNVGFLRIVKETLSITQRHLAFGNTSRLRTYMVNVYLFMLISDFFSLFIYDNLPLIFYASIYVYFFVYYQEPWSLL